MAHPLGELTLVVPPGRDGPRPEQLAKLREELAARGVDHRVVAPDGVAGAGFVVHCGSQRSLTAYAGALVESDAVLGLFPGGARNDFARTFGVDRTPAAAAIMLAGPRVMRVDVGVATVGGRQHHVLNEAVVGLGAAVTRRAARVPGRAGALLAWWATLATYRARRADVDMTFAEWHDRMVQLRLSNGQWALDRLHVAPRALPDDGAWDVQVWSGPRHLPFTLQPKMLRGEHLPHDHVSEWRQKRVAVTTPGLPVAIDERYVGRTPATFELLPQRLRLKI